MDERVAIDENFPLTDTRKAGNLRQLNFRMDDYMKYRVFDELVRPEVDAMFFNEHGSPDKQHVGSYTTEPGRSSVSESVCRHTRLLPTRRTSAPSSMS